MEAGHLTFTDHNQSSAEQLARQAKIIDALVRRASRQNDVGLTAYSAFQSAIELQAQVAAKTRDLELAATELESVRYDHNRMRENLDDALAAMEGGFALFAGDQLAVFNDLFRSFLPDISDRLTPGLTLHQYLEMMAQSDTLRSDTQDLRRATARWLEESASSVRSHVVELRDDRWFQLSVQRTSSGNMVLLLTDITGIVRQSRSEKESLIDQQAAYLQAVFEDMSSGVCTFSDDQKVMMFNGPFRELLSLPFTSVQQGMSMERLLNFMVLQSRISPVALERFRDWCRNRHTRDVFQTRVKQGTFRVLDMQANVLPDSGFLIELKDVTLESRATETLEKRVLERTAELTYANERLTQQYEQQARVEEELRIAKERAEAAVSSKTRFLAAASHDLLQPINAAKLMLATMQDTARGTKVAPGAARLHRAFSSIEQLLHSLLDISRLDSNDPDMVQPSDVCLSDLMQGIIEDQSPVAEQKDVVLRVVPSRAWVRTDPIYLLRSLQNLVVNAIQYTNPGGRVLVGCRHKKSKVVLEVWDTGIGISKADQARVFEEFARADPGHVSNGVGLGLSVVERACRHLGHKLWLHSKPNVGSRFGIELDRMSGPCEVSEQPELPTVQPDHPLDLIVMVIENDEDVLFATSQLLQQWGADVIAVTSTEDALRHVRDMGMPPDIILADYQLNSGDTGVRAIQEIRAMSGLKVPAILITANAQEDIRRAGHEIGFSVMAKPVQIARLRPLIAWKTRWQSPQAEVMAPTKVSDDSPGFQSHSDGERSRS